MALSRVGKQLLGAVIGMTLATALYMGLEQMSLTSAGMKAYLVSPGQNIADSAGQVRVNDSTADSTTIGRLSRLATTVVQQMTEADGVSSSTTINDRVQARKEARILSADQLSALATAVEYPNVTAEVSQRERLALRAARVVADHAGAPLYVPNPNVVTVPESAVKTSETKDFKGYKPVQMVTPVQTIAPTQVVPTPTSSVPSTNVQPSVVTSTASVSTPVSTPVRATVAPLPTPSVPSAQMSITPPSSEDLPDSGLGIDLLLVLSLVTALGIVRPDLFGRVIASLRHSS